MADATTQRLLDLLRPENPSEVRCAAALVLAEIGAKDAGVARAIGAAVQDADPAVRLQAMQAVGRLKVEAALPQLLARVGEGGPEAEVAAQAAARLGAKGTRSLRELMAKTAPGLRRRIAAALAAGGTASAESAAVDALLDSDSGVVDAVTRSLVEKIPTLTPAHRRELAGQVLEQLQVGKGERLPLATEAALLRLLATLGDPRGEAAFWARVDASQPPELRSAALQALGTLPAPTAPDKRKRLLACAADPDFRVAAPSLMILKGMPVQDRALADWLALLDAPDSAARRFAIDKIGAKDTREVAAGLLRQLNHRDRALRDEALARLTRLEHGREALAEALLEAETPDEAWALARTQFPSAKDYPAGLRTKIFNQASAYLEAGDRRADALLTLLREADARGLRDRLEERALALRKKKDYEKALIYLRLLTRDPACGDPLRFEQAACALKLSGHDLAAESRAADPSLQQFAGLVHRNGADAAAWVEKAKWLDPDDWFYLGFHFAEGRGPEKEFGAAVLRHVVKRSPQSKRAKDAKSKLRSQGLK
jgi:hypothetical protein